MQSPVIRRAGKVTWAVLLLCVLATLLTKSGDSPLIRYFLFEWSLITHGEVWRLISPVFVHFTLMNSAILHLLFNGVIWLNFAGAIERTEGSKRLAGIFFLSALVSNACAYWAYGPFFGGLSGVVYALVGYLWARSRSLAQYRPLMPMPTFIAFGIFLLAGYTGWLGPIANAAHLGGVITGVIYALGVNVLSRPPDWRSSPDQ